MAEVRKPGGHGKVVGVGVFHLVFAGSHQKNWGGESKGIYYFFFKRLSYGKFSSFRLELDT